jgi:hypothetical protein
MDLRCPHKKFGELTDDGYIEVKCSSKFCGEPGTVVIHRFHPLSGALIETKRFRDPAPIVHEEVQQHGSRHNSASVRSA